MGKAQLALDDDARQLVERASWPGNVRELANALERAAILATGPRIRAADIQLPQGTGALAGTGAARSGPASAARAGAAPRALAAIERDAIAQALSATGGNRREAAERLGIGLRTLYDKLKRYRLEG
jgi:two-component system, NtrC family, response regulator AtoC